MEQTVIKSDVLCIGGGIAGLMAAIRAAELGARVVVAEKGNTLRSGCGGMGNDHFRCYIPEYHGPDIRPIVNEISNAPGAGPRPAGMVQAWMEKSFDIVQLWDRWGIPMKHHGKWYFAGQTFPGKMFTLMKYSGLEQKPVLTREARKRGAEIVNRVAVFDLLRGEHGVCGAIGIDTRTDRLVVFQASSVFLGTGWTTRLYPSPTPGWPFNRSHCPASAGDGRAMAFRAGAGIADAELVQRWAGPKYFARCGKGSWVGVVRDPQGRPVGPFVTRPTREYGDPVANSNTSLFEEYCRSGRGPAYMDCRGISDADLESMEYWLRHEGNLSLLNNLAEENIELRRNPVEFMTYELTTRAGVRYNARGETSLPGLYTAGDEYSGIASGISGAAVFGWIAGENAAGYAKQAGDARFDSAGTRAGIDSQKARLARLQSPKDGITWQEVNAALEQLMNDYAGPVRSETMLEAGRTYLARLKEKALAGLQARDGHELVRCLEVLNLLDIGQLVFAASLERKETRGSFVRQDYPFTNPALGNKVLVCKKDGDRTVTEWVQVKD